MNKDNEFKKALEKSKVVFKKLEEQMEGAKSQVLKDCINDELDAYVALSHSFVNYVNALGKIRNYLHEETIFEQKTAELLKKQAETVMVSGSNNEIYSTLCDMKAFIEKVKQSYELDLKHLKVLDESCNIFAIAIERDVTNWYGLIGGIALIPLKVFIDLIQDFSLPFKALCILKEISDVVYKYTRKVPDYGNTDNELHLIETHTAIMKKTTEFFDLMTEKASFSDELEKIKA